MTPSLRFVVFLSVILGVWSAEHFYVGWRLASLPWFAESAPRRLLIGVLICLALSYPVGRWLHHLGFQTAGWSLELTGATWMSVVMLLFANAEIIVVEVDSTD